MKLYAVGAWPVCPWMGSKNPTPSMGGLEGIGAGPHTRSNDLRAARIFRRAVADARAMQAADGISTIMRRRFVSDEITRCTSPSSSPRTPMSRARTRYTVHIPEFRPGRRARLRAGHGARGSGETEPRRACAFA
jgi:hypothetical protein